MSTRPSASELLVTPSALLSRSHLRELGLERRAVDAVFRELDVVVPASAWETGCMDGCGTYDWVAWD